jgi:hypothetical protein
MKIVGLFASMYSPQLGSVLEIVDGRSLVFESDRLRLSVIDVVGVGSMSFLGGCAAIAAREICRLLLQATRYFKADGMLHNKAKKKGKREDEKGKRGKGRYESCVRVIQITQNPAVSPSEASSSKQQANRIENKVHMLFLQQLTM